MGKELRDVPVVVAGATGLVGTNLVRQLADEGARVRAIVHSRKPQESDSRVEYVQADLTQHADCAKAVSGRQIVFMCAANTSGAATMASTPMVHVTPNLIMNSLMLEASYAEGVGKYIWLSSTTGYPDTGDRPVREDEMFDGEPYEKYYFVGWMKRFTEILCRMYGEKLPKTMATIVLRPTNIYGPGDDFEPATSHVTPALIRKVVERQSPLEVWGDGKDVRDLVFVDDMVDAIMAAACKIDRHVAINIGSGESYTVNSILEKILEIDSYTDAEIVYNADRPTMIPARTVDLSLARELLGFEPAVDLDLGLSRTIDWYKSQVAG